MPNRIWKRKKTFDSTAAQVFTFNCAHDRVVVRAKTTAANATFTVEEVDQDGDLLTLPGFSSWAGSGAGGSPDISLEQNSDSSAYTARASHEGTLYKLVVTPTSLGSGSPDLTVVVSAEATCFPQVEKGEAAEEVQTGTGGDVLK